MQRVKLDRIDRQILQDLQEDGRMTNVKLSKRAGISAPPCLRRVRALEEAGYITGYHANIEPKKFGFNVTIFAQITLNSQAETDLESFEEQVRSWTEVRECHMLVGETDFLLKVVTTDWEAYNTFLTTKLTPAKNLSHVKSALSIRSSKMAPGIPIDVNDEDESD